MSSSKEYDHHFKFLMVGDCGGGRSVLLHRYLEDKYCDSLLSTVGVDLRIKTIDIDGKKIKLQIWDAAGQDRFEAIISSHYYGAQGIMLCFDLTERDSFDGLKRRWILQVAKYGRKGVAKILVGCKLDAHDRRAVTYKEAKELAEELGISYVETSAKENLNVGDAFHELAKKILLSSH